MSSKHLPHVGLEHIASKPPHSTGAKEASQKKEHSHKTILLGWIISMIGIAIYCWVMSKSNEQPDLTTVLTAIAIILIGVGVWIAGYVRLLSEASNSA